MAVIYLQGQVAVSDPTPGGPTPLSNIKHSYTKSMKLTSANFATGNVDTLVAVLPADSTISSMSLWIKTQLSGNSISAATISVGSASGGTQFLNAVSAFGTAGTFATLSPITGIFQNYNIPYSTDIQIFVRGTATTGTPTAGEMYFQVNYTR